MDLYCPLCGGLLTREGSAQRCPQGHSFDIARQGYVNLLPVQNKRSLHPGDTRDQVAARREFLDGGFYAPILQALIQAARDHHAQGPILDVGCGEGYYSAGLQAALDTQLLGLDISKEAVRFAAGRYKQAQWLCASAARLPVAPGAAGLVTSLFALTIPQEFHRVLREDGLFFQVLAAPDHLLGLKSIIYPQLLHKDKDTVPQIPGFALVESRPIAFSFTLEGRQVQNLLAMTPHAHRITAQGARNLAQTPRLTDRASCVLNIYRRV